MKTLIYIVIPLQIKHSLCFKLSFVMIAISYASNKLKTECALNSHSEKEA